MSHLPLPSRMNPSRRRRGLLIAFCLLLAAGLLLVARVSAAELASDEVYRLPAGQVIEAYTSGALGIELVGNVPQFVTTRPPTIDVPIWRETVTLISPQHGVVALH